MHPTGQQGSLPVKMPDGFPKIPADPEDEQNRTDSFPASKPGKQQTTERRNAHSVAAVKNMGKTEEPEGFPFQKHPSECQPSLFCPHFPKASKDKIRLPERSAYHAGQSPQQQMLSRSGPPRNKYPVLGISFYFSAFPSLHPLHIIVQQCINREYPAASGHTCGIGL